MKGAGVVLLLLLLDPAERPGGWRGEPVGRPRPRPHRPHRGHRGRRGPPGPPGKGAWPVEGPGRVEGRGHLSMPPLGGLGCRLDPRRGRGSEGRGVPGAEGAREVPGSIRRGPQDLPVALPERRRSVQGPPWRRRVVWSTQPEAPSSASSGPLGSRASRGSAPWRGGPRACRPRAPPGPPGAAGGPRRAVSRLGGGGRGGAGCGAAHHPHHGAPLPPPPPPGKSSQGPAKVGVFFLGRGSCESFVARTVRTWTGNVWSDEDGGAERRRGRLPPVGPDA